MIAILIVIAAGVMGMAMPFLLAASVADERLAALIKRGVPDGLAPHDFGRIVRELQARRTQVEELKRLLKYAAVYSSLAKYMPESFQKDSMEALK